MSGIAAGLLLAIAGQCVDLAPDLPRHPTDEAIRLRADAIYACLSRATGCDARLDRASDLDDEFIAWLRCPRNGPRARLELLFEGDQVTITQATSEPQRQGYSQMLLATAISRRPDVRRICGLMDGVNRSEFDNAQESGQDDEEALKATPAYKIREALGFTVIRDAHERQDGLPFLCAERP